ncbi:MAG TPA: hypothetical protein VK742_01525 [Candidatus Sulfotelmatobacter sp.]|nr:hypothetical protein [Candidatus Sulfotelmatobacter sp.]
MKTLIKKTAVPTNGLMSSTLLMLALCGFGLVPETRAQSLWNAIGGSSANTNWSTAANWTPNAVPGAASNVIFGTATMVGSLGTPNNVVDTSFSVAQLQFTNVANGDNVTLIPGGNVLTVTNGLTAGVIGNFNGYDMIQGAGTLAMTTGGNLLVDAAAGSGTTSKTSVLDLSGLYNLTVTNVNRILLGVVGAAPYNANNQEGILYLAMTNIIALSGTGTHSTNGLLAGWNSNAGNNSGIYLGQSNLIFADAVCIGSFKATGCFMNFQNGLNNPVAYFRGRSAAATSRVLFWGVGDVTDTPNAGSGCSGTIDFTGGSVDALVDKMNVGVGTGGTTGAGATGTLTFSAGTIDVNILTNGWSLGTGGSPVGSGTINVNGGTLKVNTRLVMGQTGGAGSASGTLNISSGTVLANAISRGTGNATATITMNSASLVLTNLAGTSAAPINNFSIANSTLTLSPVTGATNISVGTINSSGTANTINIGSAPLIFSYPAQFHLIGYSASTGDLTTFVLGTLPAGTPNYQGYISNNVAAGSVDLVLTNGPQASNPPPPPISIIWNGKPTGNWDTNTANWLNAGQPVIYTNITTSGSGDFVTFDDTLTGTTNVNLTTALTPGSLTINNSISNYVFSGSGKISGAITLVKQGTASLTLTENGGDDFSGGIMIADNGGTLVLDDTNFNATGLTTIGTNDILQIGNNDAKGGVSSGSITNNGGLIFNRSDSALSVGSVISGPGAVTNSGSGTVVLSVVETLTGPVVANGGTLAFAGPNQSASGISTSSGLTINTNATVQVNVDNALAGTTGKLPITINAGGFLTGLSSLNTGAGASSHLAGLLTLNGGTLTDGGTQLIPANGTWDLEGGVAVPGGQFTSIIACLDVVPHQTGGTIFNITNGTTASGIDLLVSGTLINGTTMHDTSIIKYGPGVMALDNNNTITAATTVYGGTLQLGMPGDAAALATPLGTGGGSVTLNTGGILSFGSGRGVTVTNAIGDDSTGTVLSSRGTNYLAGANTYTGTTLVLGGALTLTGAGSIGSSADIIVSNATFDISASSSPMNGSGSLSLTNSTFVLGINLVSSLNSLAVTNSTLVLAVNTNSSAANIILTGAAGAFAIGGATNRLQITSVPGYGSYPADIPVISYLALDPGATNGNNVLTTLGVNAPGVAYLTNNIANSSIDLVVVSPPPMVNINPATANFSAVATGGTLQFSWASDHLGWQLYTNAVGLTAPGSWFPVPGSAAVTNETINIIRTNPNVFFQLRYP